LLHRVNPCTLYYVIIIFFPRTDCTTTNYVPWPNDFRITCSTAAYFPTANSREASPRARVEIERCKRWDAKRAQSDTRLNVLTRLLITLSKNAHLQTVSVALAALNEFSYTSNRSTNRPGRVNTSIVTRAEWNVWRRRARYGPPPYRRILAAGRVSVVRANHRGRSHGHAVIIVIGGRAGFLLFFFFLFVLISQS